MGRYNSLQRMTCAIAKIAELSAVGTLLGTTVALLGNATVALKRSYNTAFQPSVPLPSFASGAIGFGVFMGLNANLRYQLINGIDLYTFDRTPLLSAYLILSVLIRASSQAVSIGQHFN